MCLLACYICCFLQKHDSFYPSKKYKKNRNSIGTYTKFIMMRSSHLTYITLFIGAGTVPPANPCASVDCSSKPYSSCRSDNGKAVCVCVETCPSTVEPVCASDNNTYNNECLMKREACRINAMITVHRKGHCGMDNFNLCIYHFQQNQKMLCLSIT